MLVRDRNFDSTSTIPVRSMVLSVAPAINKTDLVLWLHKYVASQRVTRASVYGSAVTAAISFRLAHALDNSVVIGTAIAQDAVPEKFKTTAQVTYLDGGVVKTKAIATAILFTAAYTVNTAAAAGQFWGAFLVQLARATGVISTKAFAADQTFKSESAALGAVPAPDAGNVALGTITVQTKAATKWTANTDDLTAASDVAAAHFTAQPAIPMSATPVANSEVDFTLGTGVTKVATGDNGYLLLLTTTDGAGAISDGRVTIEIRPDGLRGDA